MKSFKIPFNWLHVTAYDKYFLYYLRGIFNKIENSKKHFHTLFKIICISWRLTKEWYNIKEDAKPSLLIICPSDVTVSVLKRLSLLGELFVARNRS